MKKIFLLAVTIMLLAVLSCSKPPQEAIDSANSAVEEANVVEAATYAPESMMAVEDAQAALKAELDAQAQKMGLFRSYDKAKELTQTVEEAAQKARADAIAGKQQAMGEAEVLIAEAKETIENSLNALKKAPRGKGSQADINELKSDIAEAENAVTEAEEAYANENYMEAKTKAEAAKNTAEMVLTDIETAIEMRKKLRR